MMAQDGGEPVMDPIGPGPRVGETAGGYIGTAS